MNIGGVSMPRPHLILACLSALLAGCAVIRGFGDSVAQLNGYPLQPSMISPILLPLDQEMPPPLGDKIRVSTTGKDRYDVFFLDVAKIRGTLAIADTLTNQFGQALVDASNDAFKVPRADPDQWSPLIQKVVAQGGDLSRLMDRAGYLSRILPELTALAGRSESLVSQIASL